MPKLSPDAQAVLDAVVFSKPGLYSGIAAALRAAANALIPEQNLDQVPEAAGGTLGGVEWVVEKDRQRLRSELISLATAIGNHA